MPSPVPSSPHDNAELAIKNVKAFADDHLIVGIPQGLFRACQVNCVTSCKLVIRGDTVSQ